MTRQLYCKVVGGSIVAREMKDSPLSALDGDGNPVWRPFVANAAPSYDPATHDAPVRSEVIQAGQVVETWADPVAKSLADAKTALRQEIKAAAYAKIIAIVPEWKQRNLTAQATQLLKKGAANWTQDDQDAWDAGDAVWASVKAVRDASDVGEAAVDAASSVADAKTAYSNMEWPA